MRYRSLGVFSLARWSARIQSSFHEQRPTQESSCVSLTFPYRTVTCSGASFQMLRVVSLNRVRWSYNPGWQAIRFGLFRVRSPLLTESMSLSAPPGTEMFQFPGFPSAHADTRCSQRVGFPIRKSPSQGLSPARRGLSQVTASFFGSSARASTVDPCYLDLFFNTVTNRVPAHARTRRGCVGVASPDCHASRTRPLRAGSVCPRSRRLRNNTGPGGCCQVLAAPNDFYHACKDSNASATASKRSS